MASGRVTGHCGNDWAVHLFVYILPLFVPLASHIRSTILLVDDSDKMIALRWCSGGCLTSTQGEDAYFLRG